MVIDVNGESRQLMHILYTGPCNKIHRKIPENVNINQEILHTPTWNDTEGNNDSSEENDKKERKVIAAAAVKHEKYER